MPTGIGNGIAGRVFDTPRIGGVDPVESWNCDGAGSCVDPGTGTGTFTSNADCVVKCNSNPFTFKVDLTAAGGSGVNKFQLPFSGSSPSTVNVYVDWGDGTPLENIVGWNNPLTLHTFSGPGPWTINIYNEVAAWSFSATRFGGDEVKMIEIINWGGFHATLFGEFLDCVNMTGSATDSPLFSKVNSKTLPGMFENCTLWNGTCNQWATNIIGSPYTTRMFKNCVSFNQPMDLWTVWSLSALRISSMFEGCTIFNGSVGTWNMGSCLQFDSAFKDCIAFTNNLGSWSPTSILETTQSMFEGATLFNGTGVTDWNVTGVTRFDSMFKNAVTFNQPLEWVTTLAHSMNQMFSGATAFNQNICSFVWDNLSASPVILSLTDFITSSNFDITNYNALLASRTPSLYTKGITLDVKLTEYSSYNEAESADKHHELTVLPWTINDAGDNPAWHNGYCLEFNGTDQYLESSPLDECPLLGTGGTGDWTVSLWFNADVLSGSNQRLLTFGQGGTQLFQIYINTSNGIAVRGPWTDNYSSFTLSAGAWFNVIYRFDADAAQAGFVMNGTNINNKTGLTPPTFGTSGKTFLARDSGGGYFDGKIDEVAVWNRYLSDVDCTKVYASGLGGNLYDVKTDLQYWWRMGDQIGDCLYDVIPGDEQVATPPVRISWTMENMSKDSFNTDVPA